MKHGILYFLYIGKLSWISRILLLPGIIWLFKVPVIYDRALNPGFIFVLALDIFMLIMSMMPAPSDKYARRSIEKYEKEFDEYIHDTYRGKIPFDNIRILKTWQPCRRGVLNLEIKLDGNVITPNLTFAAVMEGKEEVIFESATCSLLGEDRVTRKKWHVTAADSFTVCLEKEQENDTGVDMIFPAFGGNEEERFVVTENFHLREFLAPLDALVPQNEDVRAFVRGGMLSANSIKK